MTTKKNTKSKVVTTKQKIGLGIGLTTAVVAAAGTYFIYGSKRAGKNRKAIKSWALKAKAEVLERLEQAKEMSQDEYEALLGTVVRAYTGVQDVTKGELKSFTTEMKDYWQAIEKATKPKSKKSKPHLLKKVKREPRKLPNKNQLNKV